MALPDLISGFSKALYSTWIRYRPDRLLFDCGEGCATALGNDGFAIETILLTHGHIDHVGGLAPLLWARASAKGDNQKPLRIAYPAEDLYLDDLRAYLARAEARLPFPITWLPLHAGDRIPLRAGRWAKTFATEHVKNGQTLGYKVVENRRRLTSQALELSKSELRARASRGELDELHQEYEAILLAVGGDGTPLRPDQVQDAEILLHEATLLHAGERRHQVHSTVEEAIEVAAEAKAKRLVLYHFSGRYSVGEIENEVRRCHLLHGGVPEIWCLSHDRLWLTTGEAKEATP